MEMVPPPWHIVSPSGVIHYVADAKALRALAKANDELIVSRNNKLRDLIGKHEDTLDELPLHRKSWQLRSCCLDSPRRQGLFCCSRRCHPHHSSVILLEANSDV